MRKEGEVLWKWAKSLRKPGVAKKHPCCCAGRWAASHFHFTAVSFPLEGPRAQCKNIHPRGRFTFSFPLQQVILHHLLSVLNKWRGPRQLKVGHEEDPGNYRPGSLASVPGKVMKQIILSAITWHIQDNQDIRPSRPRFRKGRPCLTNLISSYDQVTQLLDEEKAVDVAYLDFSKDFKPVFHSILLEELTDDALDRCTL